MCGPNAPSAPQLPQYPDLTPQEQNILSQQGMSLDQMKQLVQGTGTQLQQNQNILQQVSSLYNPDGTINQSALQGLQQRTQQAINQTSAAGASALNYVNSSYGTGGPIQQTTQAYTDALAGKVPENKQLAFQQRQSFQAMKEQAAQQGIEINGDNWDSAASNSTAGQKLIQNFQQNSNIQDQNYALGYVGTLGQNLSGLQQGAATAANTGMGLTGYSQSTPLGYVGQSISQGQSALSPYLTSYQQGLSQAYQPYYQQQIGPYQQQMAQTQANYQAGMNEFNYNSNVLQGVYSALTPAVSFMGFGVNPHSGSGGFSMGSGGGSGGGASSAGAGGSSQLFSGAV